MADDSTAAEDAPVTFNIKSANDAKYTVTIALSATVAELKEKLSTKDFADIPVDRQRLIYSGRVLKDAETLASYKIQAGNTVHLVKGAASNARQNPAQSSTVPPTLPTTMGAGTGNNPLAGLTGARYAGFAQLPSSDMFGPDGGMGPPPDPEDMIRMLQNPQFASTLNEALGNPQLVDTMIQQNPMLRGMGPQVRQMLQSPEFRRMMTDPEQLRSMMQMQRMFGGGMGGMGAGAGDSAFPAPGVTDTTPGSDQTRQGTAQAPAANPFAAFGQPQAGGAAANPFASLFNPAFFGNTPAQTPPTAASVGTATPTNQDPTTTPQTHTSQNQTQPQFPFPGAGAGGLFNPQMMQQMMAAMNAANPQNQQGGTQSEGQQANPFAALMNPWLMGGAPQTSIPPADTRPPEEQYATQLGQLNEMGFYDFDRNVEALRRTGGNVQGAVEYLLAH